MYKHSIICNKHVISGRCVVLTYFDHLDLTSILKTSSLDHFVTIKEQVYPDLVQYFYSNLSFVNNHVKFCVKDMDINIFLECFARSFKLSCDGVETSILIFMILSILTVRMLSPHLIFYMMMITRS